MEAKTVKLDSLSMRLATTYGGFNPRWGKYTTDICTLRQHMLMGVLKIVMLVGLAVAAIYGSGLLDLIVWLVWMTTNLQLIQPEDSAFCLMVALCFLVVIIAVGTGVAYFLKWRYNIKRDRAAQAYQEDKPSAIALAYDSWKKKLCYPVNIEK